MKRIALLMLILLGYGCGNDFSSPLRVINYRSNDIIFYSNGIVDTNENSLKIAYYEDYTLYEVPIIQYGMFDSSKEGGKIINKMAPVDTSFNYYIMENGAKNGLKYDTLGKKYEHPFSCDSLVKSLGLNRGNMGIYGVDLGKPSSIKRSDKTNKIEIEKYYTKEIATDPDSIYRYYSDKLLGIPFSFAPLLDKQHNSKLWRTVFIDIAVKSQNKNKPDKPRIESTTDIQEININYSKEIVSLLNLFKEDSKKLNLK